MTNPFMALHAKIDHNEKYQISCMLSLQAQIVAIVQVLVEKGLVTEEEIDQRRQIEEVRLREQYAEMQRKAVETN